ncbi:RNA polymerase sigma factor [Chitinophaga sp. Hz27]|uniref:RNA polymerase sigma factor n=1 Tax=Chitinophaga sp. Hz27 TaxID=3347169 RepID=UPI0035E09E62
MINTPDIHDERGLLIRLSGNDQAAFKGLYDKYHHALYRKTFFILKSAGETEDIIQEVFITLWEKRKDIDLEKPLGPWLFTVTFNRTVNHLKKSLREKSRQQLALLLSDTEPGSYLQEARLQMLEVAISQLSPQKKKVFQLCKLEGKTYEETGRLMGISKYTVKEYLGEVMASLKDYARKHPVYDTSLTLFLFLYFL